MRPEFYRLPTPHEQDVFFGLTRALYYSLEARGLIQLIRIVPKGRKKGIVLVKYSDMAELINHLSGQQRGRVKAVQP